MMKKLEFLEGGSVQLIIKRKPKFCGLDSIDGIILMMILLKLLFEHISWVAVVLYKCV